MMRRVEARSLYITTTKISLRVIRCCVESFHSLVLFYSLQDLHKMSQDASTVERLNESGTLRKLLKPLQVKKGCLGLTSRWSIFWSFLCLGSRPCLLYLLQVRWLCNAALSNLQVRVKNKTMMSCQTRSAKRQFFGRSSFAGFPINLTHRKQLVWDIFNYSGSKKSGHANLFNRCWVITKTFQRMKGKNWPKPSSGRPCAAQTATKVDSSDATSAPHISQRLFHSSVEFSDIEHYL